MYVSENYKFIYLPPQKTGSTSVSDLLVRDYNAKIFKDNICISNDLNQIYSDGFYRHWMHVPKKYENFYIFATIRNPYSRISSLYFERLVWKKIKIKKTMNYDHFTNLLKI